MREYKSPEIHRTPLYRAKAAYSLMKARCLNRNGKNPTYAKVELRMTLEEWLSWAIPEYERFQNDHPGEIPNISRLGDKGHYELGNVRLLTVSENCHEQEGNREYSLKEDGTKKCSCCKQVQPADQFRKNRSRYDGLGAQCKTCMKKFYDNPMIFGAVA